MSRELVTIEKLVVGGKGLARLKSGMVVLVPDVIPGEKVVVEPYKKKKSFQLASLIEVVEPSSDRVTPQCPYFGRCGGCHFQHISDARQDVLKKEIFFDEFSRSGLEFDGINSISYLSAPSKFGYRQRIRLHVQDGDVGFYQHGSHDHLEIDACLLARPEINALLEQLIYARQWSQLAEYVAELEIHINPADCSCILFVTMSRKPRPRDLSSLKELVPIITGISAVYAKDKHGALCATFPLETPKIHYFLNDLGGSELDIALEPGGFCQVNEEQNQRMTQQVLTWLRNEPKGRVLDLFCGVGNFSLPLARSGFDVTGIDQQRSAIRSAQENNDTNKTNCDFKRCSALDGLKGIVQGEEHFDYILLDPPRAGFKEGSHLLPLLEASKIIYVSCDQATLFRDLKNICLGGYEISAITLVDQFCQSHHLESMVLLAKT